MGMALPERFNVSVNLRVPPTVAFFLRSPETVQTFTAFTLPLEPLGAELQNGGLLVR